MGEGNLGVLNVVTHPGFFAMKSGHLISAWAVATAGLGSAVGEVAALAVDTLSKLVNAAGAAQVRPMLPDVVPPLLESLSTLEVLKNLRHRLNLKSSVRISIEHPLNGLGLTLRHCMRYILHKLPFCFTPQ